jgi:PhzF family phenazine biosynthesis protein
VEGTNNIADALGQLPTAIYKASNGWLMVVFNDQSVIEMLKPDMRKLALLEEAAVVATAPGRESDSSTSPGVDFVSRMFAPKLGVDEDPVTGSAHCILIPYWAKRLNKTSLTANQLSKRKGFLKCEMAGDRVLMSGQAVLYLKGEIFV